MNSTWNPSYRVISNDKVRSVGSRAVGVFHRFLFGSDMAELLVVHHFDLGVVDHKRMVKQSSKTKWHDHMKRMARERVILNEKEKESIKHNLTSG